MSEWLVGMWMNMTNDKVYIPWTMGFIEGLFFQSGIYNDQPVLDLVTQVLLKAGRIARKTIVGAVDASTGNFVTFTDENSNLDELPERVVSSASIPFIFPHRVIGNMTLMDGGTVWNMNLISAIERCREQVDDDSQITVDMISCDRDFKQNDTHTENSIGNFLRYKDIKSFNSGMRNVYEVQMAYPKVNYRYFFQASAPLSSGTQSMEFTPEVLGPMIEIGKKDAATVVGLGEGTTFRRQREWMNTHHKGQGFTEFLYKSE